MSSRLVGDFGFWIASSGCAGLSAHSLNFRFSIFDLQFPVHRSRDFQQAHSECDSGESGRPDAQATEAIWLPAAIGTSATSRTCPLSSRIQP